MLEWINQALSNLAASISVDNPGGLAALFFLTVSADLGFPFPFVLDTILFFTTYHAGPFSLPVFLIIMMLLGGRQFGSGILYWLSRLLGTRFINWLGKRSPSLLRNLEQLQNRLGKWTIPTIVVARLTPGLLPLSSVAAGTLRLRYYNLFLAIIVSSIVYDGTLILLGFLARQGLKGLDPKYSAWIIVAFVGIIGVASATVYLVRYRFRKN